MEALRTFEWPGNVRQLVNAARRLTVTAPGSVITAQDIPGDFGGIDSPAQGAKEWTRMLASWADRQLHLKGR
jgi:two-component system nitrogen regulation response regulator GlnG